MTDADKEDTTPSGSTGIPGRRSDGSAGPSREVAGPDAGESCTVRAGEENTEEGIVQEPEITAFRVPRMVERKTELRGQGIAPLREKKSTHRRRTEQDLKDRDPDVPYTRFETAVRDLVCSLMERQDRMNEEIFAKLNDLSYRQDDLEATVEDLRPGKRH
jgi:hypothetical protein